MAAEQQEKDTPVPGAKARPSELTDKLNEVKSNPGPSESTTDATISTSPATDGPPTHANTEKNKNLDGEGGEGSGST